MNFFSEYRVQSIYIGLMSTLILGGVLVVTGLYKFVAEEFPNASPPWYLKFILSYGLLLLLLPLMWASVTIRLENRPELRYHRIWTFVSGMLLLVGLCCLFVHCALWVMYGDQEISPTQAM